MTNPWAVKGVGEGGHFAPTFTHPHKNLRLVISMPHVRQEIYFLNDDFMDKLYLVSVHKVAVFELPWVLIQGKMSVKMSAPRLRHACGVA